MASEQPDIDFAVWLKGLSFSVAPSEIEAVRAAYRQLAQMNELNRAPVSAHSETTGPDQAR